jgi:hypothetical protein
MPIAAVRVESFKHVAPKVDALERRRHTGVDRISDLNTTELGYDIASSNLVVVHRQS